MIDLSLLFHNSAAKNGEAATNLFTNAAGEDANGSNESFAQHMNRLKPPADEIHALLAQTKHGNAEFPAAETVAESMVGAGYSQQAEKLEPEDLQAKLQSGLGAAQLLSQSHSTTGEANGTALRSGENTEAAQPLTSEEISLLFQQMNLNDPVRGNAGPGAGFSGNPTTAAGAQTLPSATEVAQLAQNRLNGQGAIAGVTTAANTQNSTTVQGSAQGNGPQIADAEVNGSRLNSAQTNALHPGQLNANERAAQQVSGDQRPLNPVAMNPQQTAQLQSAQANEGLSRGQYRSSDSEWVRREIAIKPEIPLIKAGIDNLPETQFRTQVQAQQAMAAGSQQTPLPGTDSTINSSGTQGSSHSADNQFNGLTQQLSSQPAQSTQQPGATASAQAMQYAQLSAQVGSQAWNQQLGQQLIQMAIHNQQSISLRLNPAELGQVLVNLQMDEHGAQLQLVSQNAQARAALEQALPQLRDSLAEQGIELGQSSVSDQEQQFAGRDDNAPEALANSSGQPEQHDKVKRVTTVETGISPDGRVDLYA